MKERRRIRLKLLVTIGLRVLSSSDGFSHNAIWSGDSVVGGNSGRLQPVDRRISLFGASQGTTLFSSPNDEDSRRSEGDCNPIPRPSKSNLVSRLLGRIKGKRTLAAIGFGAASGFMGRDLTFSSHVVPRPIVRPAVATVQMLPEKEYAKNNPGLAAKMNAIGHALSKNTAKAKLREARQEEELKKIVKQGGTAAKNEYLEKELQKALKEEEEENEKRKVFYTKLLMEGINPSGIEGHRRIWEWEFDCDLEGILFSDQQQYKKFLQRGSSPKAAKMWKQRLLDEEKEMKRLMNDNADIVEFFIRKNKILYGREMWAALKKEQDHGETNDKRMIMADISKMEKAFRDEGKASGVKKDYDAIFAATLKAAEEKAAASKQEEVAASKDLSKEEKQREREVAKLRRQMEKEEKAKIKAQKKAEKKELKEARKRDREDAKKEGAAALATATIVKAQEKANGSEEGAGDALDDPSISTLAVINGEEMKNDDQNENEGVEPSEVETTQDIVKNDEGVSLLQSEIPKIIKITASASVIGGGGYLAYNNIRTKKAIEEEERQRQFNLIMGIDDPGNAKNDDPDELDLDLGDNKVSSTVKKSEKQPIKASEETKTTTPSIPEPKKKRGIMTSIFSKASGNRPTDLGEVLSTEKNPETAPYAKTLSRYLTIGAPGRFPELEAQIDENDLQNVLNTNGTFQLETAKDNLVLEKSNLGISDKAAAETFANVVNAMLITLIDLASSATQIGKTSKEKDKATFDALNVVLDFMDHAASLFDSVAGGVTIDPVVYEGTLGKSKLEQMYAAYAEKTLMSFDDQASGRLETLQQVFNIKDKRAESISQKFMMKNLMKMMKNGGKGEDGEEGFADLLAAMGGAEGFPDGLPGMDGEDMSPEDLKQSITFLKQMIDSGSISEEELKEVRQQFKEAYGGDIADIIDQADDDELSGALGDDEKELLELFKSVLGENAVKS